VQAVRLRAESLWSHGDPRSEAMLHDLANWLGDQSRLDLSQGSPWLDGRLPSVYYDLAEAAGTA
jgi:hypothetical protein